MHFQAWAVMPTLNLLVDAVSRDEDFLQSTLKLTTKHDEFTANLLKTFDATKKERHSRTEVSVGVHRSDYMLDEPSGRVLQVY